MANPGTRPSSTLTRRLGAVMAALLLAAGGLAACSGDDSDGGGPRTDATNGTTTDDGDQASTTAAEAGSLDVLVTNDDGVGAPGIDALVTALDEVRGVEVTVVAPAENQSGSGGETTDGPVSNEEAETASRVEATAVDGLPADAVVAAFEELGAEPDLVLSGINAGQNIGPLVDISGTVGAAREAAARGVPALAVSQGIGPGGIGAEEELDYRAATEFATEWVSEHREAVVDGSAPDEVANMNVPTCSQGEIRGVAEAELSREPEGGPLEPQDCTGDEPAPDGDVAAFNDGFVTITQPLPGPAPDEGGSGDSGGGGG